MPGQYKKAPQFRFGEDERGRIDQRMGKKILTLPDAGIHSQIEKFLFRLLYHTF